MYLPKQFEENGTEVFMRLCVPTITALQSAIPAKHPSDSAPIVARAVWTLQRLGRTPSLNFKLTHYRTLTQPRNHRFRAWSSRARFRLGTPNCLEKPLRREHRDVLAFTVQSAAFEDHVRRSAAGWRVGGVQLKSTGRLAGLPRHPVPARSPQFRARDEYSDVATVCGWNVCAISCQRVADYAQAEDIGMLIAELRLSTRSGADKNIHICGAEPKRTRHADLVLSRHRTKRRGSIARSARAAAAPAEAPKMIWNMPHKRLDQVAS